MSIIINPFEDRRQMSLATSTVALSIYNVLAVAGKEMSLSDIYRSICNGHQYEIPKDQVISALHELCRRRLLCIHRVDDEHSIERFSTADKLHRVVRKRDRTNDGWNNWMIADRDGSLKRLEDINV